MLDCDKAHMPCHVQNKKINKKWQVIIKSFISAVIFFFTYRFKKISRFIHLDGLIGVDAEGLRVHSRVGNGVAVR